MMLAWLLGLVVLSAASVAGATSAASKTSSKGATARPAPSRAGFLTVRAGGAGGALSAKERADLLDGWVVSRPMQVGRGDGRYVGGVSYVLVQAPPAVVLRALSEVSSWPGLLPRTDRATLVSSAGTQKLVELRSGTSLFKATYSVRVESAPDRVNFWLDPERRSDIRDTWGYFRVLAFDDRRSLLTVAALVDLGPGIGRLLFEDRIQALVLGMPDRIRSRVEPQSLARSR